MDESLKENGSFWNAGRQGPGGADDYLAEWRMMTITNKQYYNEIIQSLSENHQIMHFILYASKKTLLKRLASRFEGKSSWGAQQIDRCLSAFDKDIPGTKIDTDNLNIYQVVEKVAAAAGLILEDDTS